MLLEPQVYFFHIQDSLFASLGSSFFISCSDENDDLLPTTTDAFAETGYVKDGNLYIKSIYVDSARQLKRIRPAPQGRAHRIRKRSNHVTLIVDAMVTTETA